MAEAHDALAPNFPVKPFDKADLHRRLVGLDACDVAFEGEGLVLRLRRSKTNQEGELEEVAVLYGSDPQTCPVRALQAWLASGAIVEGPLFRAVDRADASAVDVSPRASSASG